MREVNRFVLFWLTALMPIVSAEIEPMWMDYLGGTDYDYGSGVAMSSTGRIFIAGETRNTSNFVGAINQNHGGRDGFVSCVDADGQILWTAYVGGSGNDSGTKIAVDSADILYLCGFTASLNLEGAINAYHGGSSDAFVSAINNDGTIRWSCYVGGDDTDRANGIAVDPLSGDLIVGGYTESWQFSGAANSYNGGAFDGFVSRISKDGVLKESRYFGGAYSDSCEAVAVNSAGTIFLAGTTYLSDLPGALNTRMAGDDAFLASMAAGGQLQWSRYFGGSGGDRAYDLVIDRAGRILMTGYTESNDIPGTMNNSAGQSDGFVVCYNPDGSQNHARYVGGSLNDRAYGITSDNNSNIIITGSTNSTDLPVAGNGAMSGQNAFLAVLNDEGTLVMTGYLGGSLDDIGLDATTNATGEILITGSTNSYLFAGASNSLFGGSRDSFLAQMPAMDLAYADLLVNIQSEIVSAIQGTTVSVPIRIDNAGRADAISYGPGYFSTVLRRADKQDADWAKATVVGTFKLASLPANQSLETTLDIPVPSQLGRYYLRAQTDTEDTVPEQHEQNNISRIIPLDITEPPKKADLTIRKGTTSYAADPGQLLTVRVTVENSGQAEAISAGGEQFITALRMSEDPNDWSGAVEPVEPYSLAVLGVAAIHDIDFQITAPDRPGQYYLQAETDRNGVVEESNETNNLGTIMILIVRTPKTLPDLTLPGDGTIPLLYMPGEEFLFLFDSQNLADANAVSPDSAGILTTLYLANHPGVNWDKVTHVVGQTRIGLLAAGQIRYRDSIRITAPTQPGQYRLRAKIDSVNRVTESNENNNWGPMITLQVDAANQYADLMAVFPDANSVTVRSGQTFDIPLEIQNRGSASAIPQGENFFDTALMIASDPSVDWESLSPVGTERLYFLDPLERRVIGAVLTAPDQEGSYWLRARTDSNEAVVESNEDNWSSAVHLIVQGTQPTNHPPQLESIGNRTGAEGAELRISLRATDPDGDSLAYSALPLPRRASFSGNRFVWTPDYDQAGSYTITFSAKDAEFEDSETILILVTNTNRPPILQPIGARILDENQTLEFSVSASDPDGDSVNFSVPNPPNGSIFAERTFYWIPSFDQAGNYAVQIIASDGQAANSQAAETVLITVRNVNRPPTAEAGDDQIVTDLDNDGIEWISLNGSGSDPDGDMLSYSWIDNFGDTIASVENPSVALRVGVHTITLTVRDGGGMNSNDTLTVTVKEGPKLPNAPVLAPIGNQTVAENQLLSFTLQATDPDGDAIVYSAQGLPPSAKLDPQTGRFFWQPWYEDAGTFLVTFLATAGDLQDSETLVITVKDTPLSRWYNRWLQTQGLIVGSPSVRQLFGELSDITVDEGRRILTILGPADRWVQFSAESLPRGSSIIGNIFIWPTEYDQAGMYSVVFHADCGKIHQSRTVHITIHNTPLSDPGRRWLDRLDKP